MQSGGVRRVRSASAKQIRSGSPVRPQRMYDVDDTTGLDEHRRIFALQAEINRWRETAAAAAQDAHHRQQELRRLKSENTKTRRQLETVIRDLLEKQKELLAELEHWRGEVKILRDELAVNSSARLAAQEAQQEWVRTEESAQLKLQRELGESQTRAAETMNELSIVLGKLSKADTYIQTLSDEAVEYQMEIDQLREQLRVKSAREQKKESEDAKRNLDTSKEAALCRRKALEELWKGLAKAVLACSDSCDDVSRECEELIDVIKEEQRRACERRNTTVGGSGSGESGSSKGNALTGGHRQQRTTFISCKPSGVELEQLLGLLHVSQDEECHDKEDDTVAWEGTVRVIIQLICGMHVALKEAKGDVLIASRAYSELCRAGRDVAEEVTALRNICSEERAAVIALEKQNAQTSESLRVERERANQLQASLDENSDIMAEAAALTEERTSRMEKLLHDNAALEEALQAMRKTFRERDDAVTSAERRLQALQETVHREQTQLCAAQEELHRARRAAATAREECDAARSQNRELEHRLETLKAESQRDSVDCLCLRKCVEELRGQLAQLQEDRQELRSAKEALELERRQLLLQIDRMRRGGSGANGANSVGVGGVLAMDVSSPMVSTPAQQTTVMDVGRAKRETETEASVGGHDVVVLPPPSETNASMDKVRWWEAKLRAITSSMPPSTSLFATPSGYRGDDKKKVVEDMQKLAANSATLASLAYGESSSYEGANEKDIVV